MNKITSVEDDLAETGMSMFEVPYRIRLGDGGRTDTKKVIVVAQSRTMAELLVLNVAAIAREVAQAAGWRPWNGISIGKDAD